MAPIIPTKQVSIFNFQDASGQPLANGIVLFRLSTDISPALDTGPQVTAGIVTKLVLDSNGSGTVLLWPNDVLFPTGSTYRVEAYSAQGLLAWQGDISITQASYLLQEDNLSVFFLEGSTTDAILLES